MEEKNAKVELYLKNLLYIICKKIKLNPKYQADFLQILRDVYTCYVELCGYLIDSTECDTLMLDLYRKCDFTVYSISYEFFYNFMEELREGEQNEN